MDSFFEYQVFKAGRWETICLLHNTKVASKNANPNFRKESITGYYTIPFNIPREGNAKLLGFPHVLNTRRKDFTCVARLKVGGFTYCCGRLKVLKADEDIYRVVFQDNQGEFKDLITDVSIKNLCSKEVNIKCDELFRVEIKKLNAVNTSVEINFNTYTFPTYTNSLDYINDLASQLAIDQSINVIGVDTSGSNPCLIIETYSLKDIIKINAAAIYDDWRVYFPDAVKLYNDCMTKFLNNNLANAANEDYVFPVIENQQAYDYNDLSVSYSCYINYYYNGQYQLSGDPLDPNEIGTNFAYPISPQVKLSYVKRCIEENTGYKIKGDFWDIPEVKNLLFYNNVLLDEQKLLDQVITTGVIDPVQIDVPVNGYNFCFDLGDHLPNITVKQFFDFLQKKFGVVFKFDKFQKCITFTPFKSVLVQPLGNDLSDLVCSVGPKCTNSGQDGFKLSHGKSIDKKIVKGAFDDFIVGNGKNEIKTGFSSLNHFIGLDKNVDDREWKTPCVLNVATTSLYGVGENEFSPSLYFWNGLHTDSNGDSYPLGTHDNIAYDGTVLGNFSLEWSDQNNQTGTYKYFWAEWLLMNQYGLDINLNILPTLKSLAIIESCKPFYIKLNGVRLCCFFVKTGLNFDDCGFLESKAQLKTIAKIPQVADVIIDDCVFVEPDFNILIDGCVDLFNTSDYDFIKYWDGDKWTAGTNVCPEPFTIAPSFYWDTNQNNQTKIFIETGATGNNLVYKLYASPAVGSCELDVDFNSIAWILGNPYNEPQDVLQGVADEEDKCRQYRVDIYDKKTGSTATVYFNIVRNNQDSDYFNEFSYIDFVIDEKKVCYFQLEACNGQIKYYSVNQNGVTTEVTANDIP